MQISWLGKVHLGKYNLFWQTCFPVQIQMKETAAVGFTLGS